MKRGWDESDVKVRAPKNGSRPRTKRRPEHAEAIEAVVTTVDRGRYTTLTTDDPPTAVTAMKARELGKGGIVVGDRVALVGDTSGNDGTLARIVRVHERTTALRRTADDTDPFERVIVANAEQLVIVTSLSNPVPRPRMVDRCLVAAFDAGMDAVLCLTKADLTDPEPFARLYRPLDVPVVVVGLDAHGSLQGVDAVARLLYRRTSVLVGHSGVGKSTLVNYLVPDAGRQVGDVNAVTGRGRHTSTSAIALPLPTGGWVIDTPGIRSFGLAHVEPDRVVGAFGDLAEIIALCPRGCTHAAGSPDCALDEWLAGTLDSTEPLPSVGQSSQTRIDSLRRLLAARQAVEPSRASLTEGTPGEG